MVSGALLSACTTKVSRFSMESSETSVMTLRLMRRHRGEHEAVGEPLDTDIQSRQRLLERRAQFVEIARHHDIEVGDLAPFGIEEVDACCPRSTPMR